MIEAKRLNNPTFTIPTFLLDIWRYRSVRELVPYFLTLIPLVTLLTYAQRITSINGLIMVYSLESPMR
jgi:hypothetical protein